MLPYFASYGWWEKWDKRQIRRASVRSGATAKRELYNNPEFIALHAYSIHHFLQIKSPAPPSFPLLFLSPSLPPSLHSTTLFLYHTLCRCWLPDVLMQVLIPCLSPLAVAKENIVKASEEKKKKLNRSSWKEREGNEAIGDRISAGGDKSSGRVW